MARLGTRLLYQDLCTADTLSMGNSVRKFVARAPRYALRPSDNHLMRFAHEGEIGQIFTTRIYDISQSGLSFITDRENAPFIQERIKVELPLEGNEQIAWWGRVVRIEEYASHKWYMKEENFNQDRQVLVAVSFEGLPLPHVRRINATLEKKFQEISKDKKREAFKSITALWTHYTWEVAFYIGVVITAVYILWALSRPTANYDAEHGSPWGKRMWFIEK
jgi:hypothetical protein